MMALVWHWHAIMFYQKEFGPIPQGLVLGRPIASLWRTKRGPIADENSSS